MSLSWRRFRRVQTVSQESLLSDRKRPRPRGAPTVRTDDRETDSIGTRNRFLRTAVKISQPFSRGPVNAFVGYATNRRRHETRSVPNRFDAHWLTAARMTAFGSIHALVSAISRAASDRRRRFRISIDCESIWRAPTGIGRSWGLGLVTIQPGASIFPKRTIWCRSSPRDVPDLKTRCRERSSKFYTGFLEVFWSRETAAWPTVAVQFVRARGGQPRPP